MKKAILLTAGIIILAASCVFDPPEEAQIVTITELIQEMAEGFNAIDWSDKEAVLEAREESEEIPRIIYLPADTRVKIKTLPAEPRPGAAFYTAGNNTLKQTEPFYLTETKKEGLLFSYDLETWYSVAYDPENDLMNVYSDFKFKTEWEKDEEGPYLNVSFSGNYMINTPDKRTAAKFKGTADRPVQKLKKGMKFFIQTTGILPKNDLEKINVNLKENIVLFPEGTDILMNFSINGNLVNMETCEDCMEVRFLQDLFFYTKPGGQLFSISFDNENWGAPLGDFKLKPYIQVMTLDKSTTEMKLDLFIDHKEEKE